MTMPLRAGGVQPYTTEQLNALIAALNQLVQTQQQAAPSAPQPGSILQTVNWPPDPQTLIRAIFSSQAPGVAAPQFISLPTAVPALGSAKAVYNVAVGYTLLFVGPFTLTSTFYDSGLTATLTVDGQSVLYTDFPINQTYNQVLPEYGVVYRTMEAVFVNATTTDAEVTPAAEAVLMQNNTYQGIVLALQKIGFQQIQYFAENAVGQQVVPS
jgi:hypothetical protein